MSGDNDDDGRDYYDIHGDSGDYDPLANEEVDEAAADQEGELGEDEEPEEVVAVAREEKKFIRGADRTTRNIMSRYEYSRLMSAYAEQLANNAPLDPRVQIDSDDYIVCAEAALRYRAEGYEFPIEVQRPVRGAYEVWNVSELILPYELETYGLVKLPSNGPPLKETPIFADNRPTVPVRPAAPSLAADLPALPGLSFQPLQASSPSLGAATPSLPAGLGLEPALPLPA
ncbi:Hypothetical protein POVN_LOCUS420 [uncultured virus]|nr:Hypothetical protein POVN_LOCUS420 [uncultured virus]